MVFPWSLSDKSSQISRNPLSILADFKNAVSSIAYTCSLISSLPVFYQSFGIVPSAQTTFAITARVLFHSSLERTKYIYFFTLSLNLYIQENKIHYLTRLFIYYFF